MMHRMRVDCPRVSTDAPRTLPFSPSPPHHPAPPLSTISSTKRAQAPHAARCLRHRDLPFLNPPLNSVSTSPSATPSSSPPPPASSCCAREVALPEPVLLEEPALTIDLPAAAQLLPDNRSAGKVKKHTHASLSSKDRFVLGYEVDGMMQQRHSVVTLRTDEPSQSVQVLGPVAVEALQGKKLRGWRRDASGCLVALLQSAAPAAQEPTPSSSIPPTTSPTPPVAASNIVSSPRDTLLSTQHAHLHASQEQQQLAPSTTTTTSDLHQPFLQAAQQHMQQHLAYSAAGAAAVLHAAQHAMHLPRVRTFTPSRVQPISEVYVPFRLWRELFDGSTKPVPPTGVPLQMIVTGAVHMAQQEVLLVRHITRYGYYILKNVKGLSQLRGKLLVRWSLLISGVLEMEVVDEKALTPENTAQQLKQLDAGGGKKSVRKQRSRQ